ncbi:membrane progestin receptor beta-like [Narcine bancroftii]|uniref:membrane progestin receptor beta-like n=1 Tax=Narcine bancroftii TaxID=1343680 RepID=UPI0038320911
MLSFLKLWLVLETGTDRLKRQCAVSKGQGRLGSAPVKTTEVSTSVISGKRVSDQLPHGVGYPVMVREMKLKNSLGGPAGSVLEKIGTITMNPQQILEDVLPKVRGTVRVSDIPTLFREPYIHSGYRPVEQDWNYYLLSLFQPHNEALNVWTHLLAALVLLIRFFVFLETASPFPTLYSLPLCFFVLACIIYLSCSVMAHLFQSKSELVHYSFYFFDYVGVGTYQYGSALAHYYYCADLEWFWVVQAFFLPTAALLGWLSCLGCCFSKIHFQRPYPISRKVCQVVPAFLAYLLDISPIVHRISRCWATGCTDESIWYHSLQIALFLVAATFFSYPVPEKFFPGSCDIVGHGHQIFHLFLALCTLAQLEAVLLDYRNRQENFTIRGDEDSVYTACSLFLLLLLCSSSLALYLRGIVKHRLRKRGD